LAAVGDRDDFSLRRGAKILSHNFLLKFFLSQIDFSLPTKYFIRNKMSFYSKHKNIFLDSSNPDIPFAQQLSQLRSLSQRPAKHKSYMSELGQPITHNDHLDQSVKITDGTQRDPIGQESDRLLPPIDPRHRVAHNQYPTESEQGPNLDIDLSYDGHDEFSKQQRIPRTFFIKPPKIPTKNAGFKATSHLSQVPTAFTIEKKNDSGFTGRLLSGVYLDGLKPGPGESSPVKVTRRGTLEGILSGFKGAGTESQWPESSPRERRSGNRIRVRCGEAAGLGLSESVVKAKGKGAGRLDISEIFCHENSQNSDWRVPRDRESHTSELYDVKSVSRRPQKDQNVSHLSPKGLSPE
jgi:hypothetical protein